MIKAEKYYQPVTKDTSENKCLCYMHAYAVDMGTYSQPGIANEISPQLLVQPHNWNTGKRGSYRKDFVIN